jgi:3-hydroxyacyl-CoA dehydrogenase
MSNYIRKAAVLGAGVMGAQIAAQLVNANVETLLFDLPAKEGDLNGVVLGAIERLKKLKPAPLMLNQTAAQIIPANYEQDLARLSECDLIIEAIAERLDWKEDLYHKVAPYISANAIFVSNTSGLSIASLASVLPPVLNPRFCGVHFFNPPRYLRLLEIIPTPHTSPDVVDFLMEYGDVFLGKTTVHCKDTPAFIANRIGVFSIMLIFNSMEKLGLSIDEIEALTGPIIGRPKSATFRTADIVGIDTLAKVAKGVADNCPQDEARAIFNIPSWLEKMLANNWLGDKTGQGFFKKIKSEAGKEILTLNLQTLEYGARNKPKFASLEAAKPIEDLKQRLQLLQASPDKAGDFYKAFHYGLFSYISHRIPEISDELYRVDDAMMAGFGWEIGAFESWDTLGVAKTVAAMKAAGHAVAPWVDTMLANGFTSFYKVENGKKLCYDVASCAYKALPGGDAFLVLKNKADKLVWKNSACRLYDIGDGIAGFEWNSKMNSIGGEVLEGLNKAITLSEEKFNGLVIANEGPNFSAGANVGMIFMLAIEQEYDELDMAIRMFQNTMMRVRYSSIPVAVAPHALTLGGACEMSLHADVVCAAAETYIGLVELGVGLIPGGGGTKEFVLRAGDEMHDEEPETITLKNRFLSIATAKVATSAAEAFDMGILRKGQDHIVMNMGRRIATAKSAVMDLHTQGYTMPTVRKDVKVLGRSALGALLAGINGMQKAGYATAHDAVVAKKLAYVMCGGDLSEQSLVSEQYLLDLEREAFLSLCAEKKTLERIQSVLKSGRPIRN